MGWGVDDVVGCGYSTMIKGPSNQLEESGVMGCSYCNSSSRDTLIFVLQ